VYGGIATLVAGVLIGYAVFKSPSDTANGFQPLGRSAHGVEAGETQISGLNFVNRDEQSGNVEFTFDAVTPVHIQGNINDDKVQKILARALVGDQNAGSRLHTISLIGGQPDQKQAGLSPEVKTALIAALLRDRNLGVRREALSVLSNYLPDPAIIKAFLDVLANEKNTGLKIAAINSLDVTKYGNHAMNREVLDMLKRKAQSDDNSYIKIRARAALQEVQP
jgi:hypothetical protein